MEKNYHINTNCVQAGYSPKNGEPRVLPIVQSTTYKYESSEQMGRLFDLEENGYFYTRLQNPTNDAVAARITALEGGVAGMLTSSGQAANSPPSTWLLRATTSSAPPRSTAAHSTSFPSR